MAYTADPELDAATHEEELEILTDRLDEAAHRRRVELYRTFRESLAMGEASPLPSVIGADIHTLICEHPELVSPLLRWAAQNLDKDILQLRLMFNTLADAWIDDVR